MFAKIRAGTALTTIHQTNCIDLRLEAKVKQFLVFIVVNRKTWLRQCAYRMTQITCTARQKRKYPLQHKPYVNKVTLDEQNMYLKSC